jgi:probable rRNA maturation factor
MNRSGGASELSVDFTLSQTELSVSLERIAQMLQSSALRLGVSGEIGIWLCTDDEIADLHQRFMNVPGPTDVITFPGDRMGTGDVAGDIAVSFETGAEQAVDAGHSMGREIAFLCLHGLLHLAGFDDADPERRTLMLHTQEELLDAFEREYPGDWEAGTRG